jgi:hypothetical protein
MESNSALIQATETRWSWMAKCWRLRKCVRDLALERQPELDAKHLLQIELDALKAQVKAKEDEHQLARDGNRALLRFIHTRDRLNVKLEPGTIRSMLQNTEKQ